MMSLGPLFVLNVPVHTAQWLSYILSNHAKFESLFELCLGST
jgi:hypothetical protein